MDCAKVVGARIVRPNKQVKRMKGALKVLHRLLFTVAVPTTAGTGSETTLAALITDSETHHKFTINDFSLIPHAAVLDAEVTRSLPPRITATTGMDALTYAVEAYGESAHRKIWELACAMKLCDESASAKEGAERMIGMIRRMNAEMEIPEILPGIRGEDIPGLAAHAEAEANPLYPVPKLMTRGELEQFYYDVMEEEA